MQNAKLFAYIKKKSYLCAKIAQKESFEAFAEIRKSRRKKKISCYIMLRGFIIGQLRVHKKEGE